MQRTSIQQVVKIVKGSKGAMVPLGLAVTMAVSQASRTPLISYAEDRKVEIEEKPEQHHHHLFEHPTVEEMEADAKTPLSRAVKSAANASFFADLHRYGLDDFSKFSC
jgi:hypothetical protein